MYYVSHEQVPVRGPYEGSSLYQSIRGRSFDDSEPYLPNNRQTNRARGLPENSLLKSFPADKEKAGSVAKIKVVVCFYSVFISGNGPLSYPTASIIGVSIY